jgi:hypothetical protein
MGGAYSIAKRAIGIGKLGEEKGLGVKKAGEMLRLHDFAVRAAKVFALLVKGKE